jgi:AraC family transcriptional regulator, alkane utilization regulator
VKERGQTESSGLDVLSDVLRVVRLSGGSFLQLRVAKPWSVAWPPAPRLARLLGFRGRAGAVIHLVSLGDCWLILGRRRVKARAGAVLLLPQGMEHRLASAPEVAPVALESLLGSPNPAVPSRGRGVRQGRVEVVSAGLAYDQPFHPLIRALPCLLLCLPEDGCLFAQESPGGAWVRRDLPEPDHWLMLVARRLVEEAKGRGAGREAILRRLAELLCMELIRRYARGLPEEGTGWLTAIKDPQVGLALRALHQDPTRKWTVPELGREVGVSRSRLAQRFRELIGESPMRYLAAWRVHLAQRLLRDDRMSVAQVASRVGFESSVAFHHAFKRQTGQSPVAWRRTTRP